MRAGQSNRLSLHHAEPPDRAARWQLKKPALSQIAVALMARLLPAGQQFRPKTGAALRSLA